MKKIILLVSIFPLLGLNSCGGHNHNWGTVEYSWNEDYSTCTAQRICKDDPTHIEKETVDSTYVVITEAKCESNGIGRYTADFKNESFDTKVYDITLEATGHDWKTPTYSWSDDNLHCTAKAICNNDSSHVLVETVNTKYEIIKEPDYEEDGVGKYTASFQNPEFEEQVKEIQIQKLEKLVFTSHESYYSVKSSSPLVTGNIVIPSIFNELPVTTIEKSGFVNCSLIKSIILPNSITSIGKSAFAGCTSLQSINIPGSVAVIYDQAFNGCASLKTVTIGKGVSSIGTRNSGSWAFKGCTALEELYLPDSIGLIGVYAFQGCTSLKNVRWPDNYLEIQSGAFYQCESLRTAPTKIAEMHSVAFAGCKSLTEVTIPNAYFDGADFYSNCTSLKKAIFVEGATKVPTQMFNSCPSLTQIVFSSTITTIQSLSIIECEQLLEVVNKSSLSISKSDEIFVLCNNIEAIITNESYSKLAILENFTYYIKMDGNILLVDYANKECTTLTIPSYITEIGNAALYNFKNLETLNYEGTKDQWSSLKKGSNWNTNIHATIVHCSDGTINL